MVLKTIGALFFILCHIHCAPVLYQVLDDSLEIIETRGSIDVDKLNGSVSTEDRATGNKPRTSAGLVANIFMHQYSVSDGSKVYETQVINPGSSVVSHLPKYQTINDLEKLPGSSSVLTAESKQQKSFAAVQPASSSTLSTQIPGTSSFRNTAKTSTGVSNTTVLPSKTTVRTTSTTTTSTTMSLTTTPNPTSRPTTIEDKITVPTTTPLTTSSEGTTTPLPPAFKQDGHSFTPLSTTSDSPPTPKPSISNRIPILENFPQINLNHSPFTNKLHLPANTIYNPSGSPLESIAPYLRPGFYLSGAIFDTPTRKKRDLDLLSVSEIESSKERKKRSLMANNVEPVQSGVTTESEAEISSLHNPRVHQVQNLGPKNQNNMPASSNIQHSFDVKVGGSAFQVIFDRPIVYIRSPGGNSLRIHDSQSIQKLLSEANLENFLDPTSLMSQVNKHE